VADRFVSKILEWRPDLGTEHESYQALNWGMRPTYHGRAGYLRGRTRQHLCEDLPKNKLSIVSSTGARTSLSVGAARQYAGTEGLETGKVCRFRFILGSFTRLLVMPQRLLQIALELPITGVLEFN
jgi:hypothetical protein